MGILSFHAVIPKVLLIGHLMAKDPTAKFDFVC